MNLIFEPTPHGTWRIWVGRYYHDNDTHQGRTLREILKRYCLWGGPDRIPDEQYDNYSYEFSQDKETGLDEDLSATKLFTVEWVL